MAGNSRPDIVRKRKAHGKSRQGCRNCKLRRVKCDERKPRCKKCSDYGVVCTFTAGTPDLQMVGSEAVTIEASGSLGSPPGLKSSTNQVINIWHTDTLNTLYPALNLNLEMDRELLNRFSRFHNRTVLTMGASKFSTVFQSVTAQLAFSHPYLMHVAQTVTAIHDRYLSTLPLSQTCKQTTVEAYHLSRAAALFSQRLSSPIGEEDCDPLRAAAALLGIIAFATIEGSTPEEVWPLKVSDPTDFEWINMSEHKCAVWNATDFPRVGGIITYKVNDHSSMAEFNVPIPDYGIEGIPPLFLKLFELDASSTTKTSPFYEAVHRISYLLGVDCDRERLPLYLGFIGHIQPKFKDLVFRKDPRALLLMAYWYAMVGRSAWHLERRTVLQGQATCIYLDRHYPEEAEIHKLLEYPKLKLGLIAGKGMPTPPWEEWTMCEVPAGQLTCAPDQLLVES